MVLGTVRTTRSRGKGGGGSPRALLVRAASAHEYRGGRSARSRWLLTAGAAALTVATHARAELVSWDAPPSCPPPLDARLVGTAPEPGIDELNVSVRVEQTDERFRAVLTSQDSNGIALGERVLEQATCDELNRVVVVSLTVLLGVVTPEPRPTPQADFSPNIEEPRLALSAEPPTDPSPVQAAAPPTSSPVTTSVVDAPVDPNELPPDDEFRDAIFAQPVSPPNYAPGRFELMPALAAGLDLTSVTSLGVGLAGVVGLTKTALRVHAAWRATVPAVDAVPQVAYSVLSFSGAVCAPISAAGNWILCLGPHLEHLRGSMALASDPEAMVWLEGASLSLTRFGGSAEGVLGWFGSVDLVVRRGADFQLSSPSTTVFEYPSVGLLLSLGPDFRL